MPALPRLLTMLALFASLLFSGCATRLDEELLDIKLVNLRFVQSRVLETDAVFTLRIENESSHPLRVTGGVHKFYINGEMVGKGMSGEAFDVPRLSTVEQDVTVHLSNITMARKIRPIIERQRVHSRADSMLYCEAGGREHRVHVSHETTLDVREFVPERQTYPGRREP